MGACTFITTARGATAKEAFASAADDARYMHGHGGYTGTIAEKGEFIMVTSDLLSLEDASARADQLLQDDDPRISDKWGPAGCIALSTGQFLFFGWASS
jgi:hypothetical protein